MTFGDICDTINVIQVAADGVLDLACRLVGFRFSIYETVAI